jgi:hypothetical protein
MTEHDEHQMQQPSNTSKTPPTSNTFKYLAEIALALGLIGVVIDIAVETYLANSPIKWFVVIGASLSVVLAFVDWVVPGWARKKYGWNLLSFILFLLITGSVALVFWLVPFQEQTFVFAGGRTLSILLYAISIAAVLVGALLLLRIAPQSMILRIVVGLSTLYVLFSFIQGWVEVP